MAYGHGIRLERHGQDVRYLDGGNAEADAMFEHLTGNRGTSPETRTTPGGQAVTYRSGTDADGNDVRIYYPSKGKRDFTGPPTIEVDTPGKSTKLRFVGDN